MQRRSARARRGRRSASAGSPSARLGGRERRGRCLDATKPRDRGGRGRRRVRGSVSDFRLKQRQGRRAKSKIKNRSAQRSYRMALVSGFEFLDKAGKEFRVLRVARGGVMVYEA